MHRSLLVESHRHQSRVVLLEDGRPVEMFLERVQGGSVVGHVYKGRVSRVLPGIQAAFVDIGEARDAFLYVDDIARDPADLEALEDDEGDEGEEGPRPSAPSISELISQGQELLVQVLKDPLANKGARISTQVTLPGRFLVLLPTVNHYGVSRRIEEFEERERLRALVEDLSDSDGGLIVRTAGRGKGREEFLRDREYLQRLWHRIQERARASQAPAHVHGDLDLPLRTIRDLLTEDVEEVRVEGRETWSRIVEFLDALGSPLVDRVRLEEAGDDLFERFGVESAIEGALRSRVWLPSGGYLVIHPTEALVAIDVNTGRYVGRSSLEETVVRINLEAVEEVVRQIRLRDLAGIIVVDFIDMEDVENRRLVFESLERELTKDRARNRVLAISEFGLVEITRKRSRTNLYGLLTRPCIYCEGSGRLRSVTTICLEIRRRVLSRRAELGDGQPIRVEVHPEIAAALTGPEAAIVQELREVTGTEIRVEGVEGRHWERFHIRSEGGR